MLKKRYEIQVIYKNMGPKRRWATFYSANACYTLSGAREELNRWENHQWDFVSDEPCFRIFDRKTGKAVA